MRRTRVFAWVAATALLATAVVTLRVAQPPRPGLERAAPAPTAPSEPVRVESFVADGVTLPEPGSPPRPVAEVVALVTGADRARVSWADALPGGAAPDGVAGYAVSWPGGERLVVAPETELTWADGVDLHAPPVEVRAVDAWGRRSEPVAARVETAPDPADDPRLTGLLDRFDGPFAVDTASPGARWRLGGEAGCVETGPRAGVLAIDVECSSGGAVLRARAPLRLAPGPGERARVLVVTDAAGPDGAVTIDLVAAAADHVGGDTEPPPAAAANGTAVVDPALPGGTIRVRVDDDGARVLTGAGVPTLPAPPAPERAPARGVGALHAFEVVLDDAGVRVLQDGRPVAAAGVLPPWGEATLLVGIGDPRGRESRARVDAIGFSGERVPPADSYAVAVAPAAQRVLGPAEGVAINSVWRGPLAGALAARLVATVRIAPGLDLAGLRVEIGSAVLPMRPVTPDAPTAAGADVTVAADLPASALALDGPAALSPLVLRAPGADGGTTPVSSAYLDITPFPCNPGPCGAPAGARPARPAPERPPSTALPRPSVELVDDAGVPVTTVAPGARVHVDVRLDGLAAQFGGARLAGVAGVHVLVDSRLIAAVPTAVDGPGLGGSYRVALSTRGLAPGRHDVEVRVVPADPAQRPASTLTSWTITD